MTLEEAHSDPCGYSNQNYDFQKLNTSYLTDSYIIFTLKMESVSKNTIFGQKLMVKSGLEKIILKFHDGLQSCCCPVQNYLPIMAELALQLRRYL